jgi:four helix bundle protein
VKKNLALPINLEGLPIQFLQISPKASSRLSKKDKARFIQIAYSSLMEVVNFLIISNRLNFISNEQLTDLREKIEKLSNKLNAFHNTIK